MGRRGKKAVQAASAASWAAARKYSKEHPGVSVGKARSILADTKTPGKQSKRKYTRPVAPVEPQAENGAAEEVPTMFTAAQIAMAAALISAAGGNLQAIRLIELAVTAVCWICRAADDEGPIVLRDSQGQTLVGLP